MNTLRRLGHELTIYTAAETRGQLLAWLNEDADGAFVLDAGAVADVDGAGLQLLLSLSHTLAARQRALRLHEPSAALCEAGRRLGLAGLLTTESRA